MKLSLAQLAALRLAAANGGMVKRSTRPTSIAVLEHYGLIAKWARIRNPPDRERLVLQKEAFIVEGRRALATGDWMKALSALESARERDTELHRMAYWITDAGREAAK